MSASFVDLEIESPIRRIVPGEVEPDVATNAGTGRMWVILLGSPGQQAQLASRKFVEEALGPNDQVAIISVHGTMSSSQPFTRNRSALLSAITRLGVELDESSPRSTQTAYRVTRSRLFSASVLWPAARPCCSSISGILGASGPPPMDLMGGLSLNDDTSDYLDQRDAIRAATRNNVAIYWSSPRRE